MIPGELADALRDAALTGAFEALAPSHRDEYARWVAEAKRPETRARRAAKAVEMIRHRRTGAGPSRYRSSDG